MVMSTSGLGVRCSLRCVHTSHVVWRHNQLNADSATLSSYSVLLLGTCLWVISALTQPIRLFVSVPVSIYSSHNIYISLVISLYVNLWGDTSHAIGSCSLDMLSHYQTSHRVTWSVNHTVFCASGRRYFPARAEPLRCVFGLCSPNTSWTHATWSRRGKSYNLIIAISFSIVLNDKLSVNLSIHWCNVQVLRLLSWVFGPLIPAPIL